MGAVKQKRLVCYILVIALLFLGVSVGEKYADASFVYPENEISTTGTIMSASSYVEKEDVCTLNMLSGSNSVLRSNFTDSMLRGSYRDILSLFIVGSFLQYLFYYQTAESKEDGQLFLCRTVVVDYIHLKDSGE